MRTPSLRQIEAFMAFVEAGSVSRAADVLRISQPAASKLLGTLETDAGLQLFKREGRLLSLTAQGMRFYNEIDKVFAGVHQIARAVDMIRREERGRLHVGVSVLMGPLICRAIKGFLKNHPETYISVIERSSQFITDQLIRGQLDVGVISTFNYDKRIHSELFSIEPLVCVVPLSHRFAGRKSIMIEDLQDERFIATSPGSVTRLQLDKMLEAHSVTPNIVLDANTSKNACELVAAELGIAVVHPLSVLNFLRDQVSFVKLPPESSMGFHFCYPLECRNISLVNAFASEVKKSAKKNLSCLTAARTSENTKRK